MEKIYRQVLLYDFYGELLKEHQKAVYEEAVCNDLSLSEIAQQQGISRQGVHDLIKRCDKILQNYEDTLHLVERFTKAREKVQEIQSIAESGAESSPAEMLEKIKQLSLELLQEL